MEKDFHLQAAPPQQSNDDEIDVALYLRAFYRYKWSIISITVLAGIIGLLVSANLVPLYQAKASILIESENRVNQVQLSPMLPELNFNVFRRTQIDLLRSRTLAEQVIQKLNIDFSQKTEIKTRSDLQLLISVFKTTILQDNNPPPKQDPINLFLNNLHIIDEKKSELIYVQFQSPDQQLVARVTNEVIDSYIQLIENEKSQNENENMSWLTHKLDDVRSTLVESEAKLASYQESEQIQGSTDEQRIKNRRIDKITQELITARTRKSDSIMRYKQIQTLIKKKGKNSVLAIVKNPFAERLREEKSKLERVVKELDTRYGNKHPKMISAKADLRIAKRQVRKEVNKILLNARKETDLAIANEKEISKLYSELHTVPKVKTGKAFGLAKLELDVATNRELYDLLLTKLKTTDINKRDDLQNVKIVDRAVTPTQPFKPNKKLIIVLSLVLGLMCGVFFAMIRTSMDKTFKTIDDIKNMLGTPILGVVPMMQSSYLRRFRLEHLVKLKPRSTIAEAFNNIRTNIILNKSKTGNKTILVTSSIASEGKTTISSNLGMALALLGPTLIIEADARKPRFKEMLDVSCQGGMLEYLSNRYSLKQSLVQDPDIDSLYTMPINAIPAHPAEIFTSKHFSSLIEKLKTSFKYIVIDSPPILPVSDSLLISQYVDDVVLVIGAESTTKYCAKESLDRLNRINAPVLGVILSQVNQRDLPAYGYYGYGYGSYTQNESHSLA